MNYFIIDHPNQIEIALGLINQKSLDKSNCTLLVSKHEYHKSEYLSELSQYFTKIILFPRVNYGKNLFKDFLSFIITYFKVNFLQIKTSDHIYCFSFCQNLENNVLAIFKNNFSEIFLREDVYNKIINSNFKIYTETASSIFFNKIYTVFGMNKFFFGKQFFDKNVDGSYILQYCDKNLNMYNQINILSNEKIKRNKDNKIKYYQISFLQRNCKELSRKQVIYFGNCFLLFDNLPLDQYIKGTNKVLSHIRKIYFEDDIDLIYMSHPREINEFSFLDTSKFKKLNNHFSAENYLLKNFCNIESTHSIGSTSSLLSSELGINTFIYYSWFPYETEHLERFGKLFSFDSKIQIKNKLD